MRACGNNILPLLVGKQNIICLFSSENLYLVLKFTITAFTHLFINNSYFKTALSLNFNKFHQTMLGTIIFCNIPGFVCA